MGLKKRIKTISRLTQSFIAEGESERADFKRLPEGISADDLVAFANSESGGNILAGIDEQVVNNTQVGVVRGCDVSDATILQVLNKAVGCIPPVSIDVFIENLNDKPILRIEVPSSPTKPHCTPKGVYCRRDGARNRPLHPTELLKVFLETEASAFAARFEVAAERITAELGNLETSLDKSIKNMSDQLGWTDFQLGDTESTLDTIQAMVGRLSKETDDLTIRLRALFRQDKRDDPVYKRERLKYLNHLVEQIRGNDRLLALVVQGGTLSFKAAQDWSADVTHEDAKELLKAAVKFVREQEELKKYSVQVKAPKNYSVSELDEFSKIVADEQEVAEGVRARVERAYRLGIITYDGTVVGTASLKKPSASYRRKVFEKAKSKHAPIDYPYELGWIFLKDAHREKGQMTRLLKELMPAATDSAMFATTRSVNEIMQEMLIQFGFSRDGEEYPSEQRPDQMLQLYVRGSECAQSGDK
jgi:predicted GNAT family N-acyltransferase